jgi:hypothetical protein
MACWHAADLPHRILLWIYGYLRHKIVIFKQYLLLPVQYFIGTFGIRLSNDILDKYRIYVKNEDPVRKTDATLPIFQIV